MIDPPVVPAPTRRPEIDQYTIKLLIGLVAFFLPLIELAITRGQLGSISESFWISPSLWPRNIFVGFLFVIGALLLAYNGTIKEEMVLGRVAALAAFLIAMFPCACGCEAREIIPRVHAISAATMFIVLTWFCWHFYRNAEAKMTDPKQRPTARRRMFVYAICAFGTAFSIVLCAYLALTGKENETYIGESIGLISFGLSWLTASRKIPGLTTRHVDREPLF